MRISFVVPWITQSRGGTENVGQMMANAMVGRGHVVDVFTFDDLKQPTRWPLHPSIRLHHVEEAATPAADSRITLAIAQAVPDLLVGLHMNRTLLRYVKIGHRIGVPVVLSEHIDPVMPVRVGSTTTQERLTAFQGAARIHLLTETFAADVPAHLRPKIRVIPNTTPTPARLADPAGAEQLIVTVARLVPRKNIAQLIEEFAAIAPSRPGWTLGVIGDGPEMSALKATARAHGVARRVTFFGHIEDPYRLLETAQIFALPSLYEGFPMSSLEAMAHGLPVVGYANCNGINVQVVDGVTGRLVADSARRGAFGEALAELIDDADLRRRMGAASHARFESDYAAETVFTQWERMFREAAEDWRPSPPPSLEQRLEMRLHEEILHGR